MPRAAHRRAAEVVDLGGKSGDGGKQAAATCLHGTAKGVDTHWGRGGVGVKNTAGRPRGCRSRVRRVWWARRGEMTTRRAAYPVIQGNRRAEDLGKARSGNVDGAGRHRRTGALRPAGRGLGLYSYSNDGMPADPVEVSWHRRDIPATQGGTPVPGNNAGAGPGGRSADISG